MGETHGPKLHISNCATENTTRAKARAETGASLHVCFCTCDSLALQAMKGPLSQARSPKSRINAVCRHKYARLQNVRDAENSETPKPFSLLKPGRFLSGRLGLRVRSILVLAVVPWRQLCHGGAVLIFARMSSHLHLAPSNNAKRFLSGGSFFTETVSCRMPVVTTDLLRSLCSFSA